MSKHHHHPHEGHGPGNPPRRAKHNAFFYVAGFFILLGLICFILWGTFGRSPVVSTPMPATVKQP